MFSLEKHHEPNLVSSIVYVYDLWIESSNEQHLFEIELFCNIINALTDIFE